MSGHDPARGRAVVSLVVRTEGDEMHTMIWWIPGCCAGEHIEEFRAVMIEAAGPPASETLRSQAQGEALARLAEDARGIEL